MREEIKNMTETKKLIRLTLAGLLIWAVGVLLFAGACRPLDRRTENLLSSKKILNAAHTFYSRLPRSAREEESPLTALTGILGGLGLKERAEITNTASTDMTVRIPEMNGQELILFLKGLSEKGLTVRTAEMRAFTSPQKGRLINLSILIGTASDDSF